MIYSLTCPTEMEFFGSPGRIWVNVLIPEDASGKTLRIEFSSPFQQYQTVPTDLYWLEYDEIQPAQTSVMWIRNTAALIILGLGIISYANANIWKNKKLRHYLFTIGDFYLTVALWVCSEINVIAVILGRTGVSSLLAMVFIRLMPVTFYYLYVASIGRKTWWLRIAGGIVWLNFGVSILLQFVFHISMVALLPYHTILTITSALICISGMIYEFITQPHMRHSMRIYYASIILLVGALCEANSYVNRVQFGRYSGVAISVTCIIYALFVHVFLVEKEALTDVEKRELELHYKILQRKPLTSQINAHFLGNTLNTISAYCKQDAQKADRAIQLLAVYMREYMHLVNESDYVGIEDEIYLVELYLKIQNMRFDNSITLDVKNEFEDFVLPPLCLQPLVENAVAHGLRRNYHKGNIFITTKRIGKRAEIVVGDNGSGFIVDDVGTYMGVGLTNVNARILAMGGIMEVHSQEGKGTKVILRVPMDLDCILL